MSDIKAANQQCVRNKLTVTSPEHRFRAGIHTRLFADQSHQPADRTIEFPQAKSLILKGTRVANSRTIRFLVAAMPLPMQYATTRDDVRIAYGPDNPVV